MGRKTIFQTQIVLYMSILFLSFSVFGLGISALYTRQYIKDQEQQLILQGERFRESVMTLYYTGNVDMSRMDFELQVLEKYMGVSVFFMNGSGDIGIISENEAQAGIEKSITEEAVEIVMSGGIAKVQGKLDNGFNESVLTVGYPIIVDKVFVGGVFMCKPINMVSEVTKELRYVIGYYMAIVILMCSVLIYVSSKRISKPLTDMNEVAKIIADGDFEHRIEVTSTDEVGQLAESLNNMAESLEKNENNRRKFIANISHDLRSPLTSIQGFISAIADGTIPPEKHEHYFEIIMEETARLNKLANDMTDLSKAEAGAIRVEKCEFDINDMLRESLELFERRFMQKKIQANAVFAEEFTNVMADPNMILRVIYNLVDNAIKFTPEGGEITVETAVDDDKVYISVKDTGDGISKTEQRKVFDRFFKSDTSRGQDKSGVGLGLSIVKEFIKAHGETIEVFSNEGEGTIFTFTLSYPE